MDKQNATYKPNFLEKKRSLVAKNRYKPTTTSLTVDFVFVSVSMVRQISPGKKDVHILSRAARASHKCEKLSYSWKLRRTIRRRYYRRARCSNL